MKTYYIAIAILLALVLWMMSGTVSKTNNTAPVAAVVKDPVQVRVANQHIENKQINLVLQGKTQAKRLVDIKAEVAGKLIQTPVERGDHVKKGDVLCQLAEEDRPAQLLRAQASVKRAEIDYQGSEQLYKKGQISSSTFAASKEALDSNLAVLRRAELNVAYLQMRAPFDAYIENRPAQVGALIERGDICATLLDESLMLAIAQVSSNQVNLLEVGQTVSILYSDKKILTGKISFIARTADSVTRTYPIEIEIDNNQGLLRAGITSQINVPLAQVQAHHISGAVLALDENSQVSVRIVDENDTVQMVPVTVVDEDLGGVWVTGLADTVRLIVVGQELVQAGEKVIAINKQEKE